MISFHVDSSNDGAMGISKVNGSGAILVSFMLECMDGWVIHHVLVGGQYSTGRARGV